MYNEIEKEKEKEKEMIELNNLREEKRTCSFQRKWELVAFTVGILKVSFKVSS